MNFNLVIFFFFPLSFEVTIVLHTNPTVAVETFELIWEGSGASVLQLCCSAVTFCLFSIALCMQFCSLFYVLCGFLCCCFVWVILTFRPLRMNYVYLQAAFCCRFLIYLVHRSKMYQSSPDHLKSIISCVLSLWLWNQNRFWF